MSNKLIRLYLIPVLAIAFALPAAADDFMDIDVFAEQERPVFLQIADFEQERILLQLEKEKMQLVLDIDRMAVEQARLRADASRFVQEENEEVRRLAAENQRLEREMERLARDKERLEERLENARENAPQEARSQRPPAAAPEPEEPGHVPIFQRFALLEIVGVGRQLQATIEDLNTGQKRRVWVGRGIDGYDVLSISLDDGVVFSRDGVTESLTIGSGRD
jgi:type IV pilus biogenesis protein PilP